MPLLPSRYFNIERLTHDDYDLRVSYNCLNCGFTAICDLYKFSLEACLKEHLQACPNVPAERPQHGFDNPSRDEIPGRGD